mmetsp:Transcript_125607/g.228684  ORF Transcript_125607/g.228684 Transcript_125607/m.228684 type:complete len:946 (+) Transcript_125607:54-2891(+)
MVRRAATVAILSFATLVQTVEMSTLSLHHGEEQLADASPDECACLNWRETYRAGDAVCGQGQELLTAVRSSDLPRDLVQPFVEMELCNEFFEKLDHRYCVIQDMSPRRSDAGARTWCYVSSACQRLNGGASLGEGAASWKVCDAREDAFLGSLAPAELVAQAEEHELNLGLLVKAAYPLEQALWSEVESFWWTGDGPEAAEKPRQVKNAQTPVIYEVRPDGQGDKVVVSGESVWSINLDEAEHPGTRFSYTCTQGCGDVSARAVTVTTNTATAATTTRLATGASAWVTLGNAECQCFKQNEVDALDKARCGRGRELFPALFMSDLSWEKVFPSAGDICAGFFEKLDHDHEVTSGLHTGIEQHNAEWCYVSDHCSNLNGGSSVLDSAVNSAVHSPDDAAAIITTTTTATSVSTTTIAITSTITTTTTTTTTESQHLPQATRARRASEAITPTTHTNTAFFDSGSTTTRLAESKKNHSAAAKPIAMPSTHTATQLAPTIPLSTARSRDATDASLQVRGGSKMSLTPVHEERTGPVHENLNQRIEHHANLRNLKSSEADLEVLSLRGFKAPNLLSPRPLAESAKVVPADSHQLPSNRHGYSRAFSGSTASARKTSSMQPGPALPVSPKLHASRSHGEALLQCFAILCILLGVSQLAHLAFRHCHDKDGLLRLWRSMCACTPMRWAGITNPSPAFARVQPQWKQLRLHSPIVRGLASPVAERRFQVHLHHSPHSSDVTRSPERRVSASSIPTPPAPPPPRSNLHFCSPTPMARCHTPVAPRHARPPQKPKLPPPVVHCRTPPAPRRALSPLLLPATPQSGCETPPSSATSPSLSVFGPYRMSKPVRRGQAPAPPPAPPPLPDALPALPVRLQPSSVNQLPTTGLCIPGLRRRSDHSPTPSFSSETESISFQCSPSDQTPTSSSSTNFYRHASSSVRHSQSVRESPGQYG